MSLCFFHLILCFKNTDFDYGGRGKLGEIGGDMGSYFVRKKEKKKKRWVGIRESVSRLIRFSIQVIVYIYICDI